jgi:hypothetical protein
MVLEPAGLRRWITPAAADPLHGGGGGRKICIFSFAPNKTAQVLESHSGGCAARKKVRDPVEEMVRVAIISGLLSKKDCKSKRKFALKCIRRATMQQ